jgi:hypothetical protein
VPTLPLSEAAFVTLDASGNGTARVGPNAHGVVWKPSRVAIKTSSAVLSPVCQLFIGNTATSENFIDGTFTGQQNATDSVVGQELRLRQYVWAVWTGGDVGAQATLTVTGSKDVG